MLPKYAPMVHALPAPTRIQLANHLGLSPHKPVYPQLRSRGYFTADVVLTLLAIGTADARAGAQAIIGKPIEVCRPGPHYRETVSVIDQIASLPETVPPADRRKVLSVERNPRLPTTDSFQRYKHFRPGRTVAQLIGLGVTRKDLREALREGWVTLSEVPA